MREIRNKTLLLVYLCFERDLFLRNLEREQERDRRGRLERLEERLVVPTEMGRTASATERTKHVLFWCLNMWFNSIPGSMAAAMVDWASLTLFITLSSSLAAACGVISGGLTIALLEWLILKHTFHCYSERVHHTEQVWSLWVQHGLQGSVSKHDSVEGQRSGDRVLLRKLHEGEARRLSLVSGHSDELHAPHLPEELQQLVCSGGLQTGRNRVRLQSADLSRFHPRRSNIELPESWGCRRRRFAWSHQPLLGPRCPWGEAERAQALRFPHRLTSDSLLEGWAAGRTTSSGSSCMSSETKKKQRLTHILEWIWSRNGQQPPTGYQTGHWRGRCQKWQGLGLLWDFPCGTEG